VVNLVAIAMVIVLAAVVITPIVFTLITPRFAA
jgi:hypothetical protein